MSQSIKPYKLKVDNECPECHRLSLEVIVGLDAIGRKCKTTLCPICGWESIEPATEEDLNRCCCCGGETEAPHLLGEGNCYREWVPKEENPHIVSVHPERWAIPGENGYITDVTLKQQRGYYYHLVPSKWSRPKDHESTNSLEA